MRGFAEEVLSGSGLSWEGPKGVAAAAEAARFDAELLRKWLSYHAANGWRTNGGTGPKLKWSDLSKNMWRWRQIERHMVAEVADTAERRRAGTGRGGRNGKASNWIPPTDEEMAKFKGM